MGTVGDNNMENYNDIGDTSHLVQGSFCFGLENRQKVMQKVKGVSVYPQLDGPPSYPRTRLPLSLVALALGHSQDSC